MRARIFLLSGGVALIAAAFVVQACGSTEDTPAVTTDAGLDTGAADTGKKDTGPPVDDDAATCDLSNDFTSSIPDAAIGDSGATTGECVGCAKQNCSGQIAACNADCPCQGLAGDALSCYLKDPSNAIGCAATFSAVNSTTQGIGISLLTCINSKCKTECATDSFTDGGADGGDGGDGG